MAYVEISKHRSPKSYYRYLIVFSIGICLGGALMLLIDINGMNLARFYNYCQKIPYLVGKKEIPSFTAFIKPNINGNPMKEYRANETELSDIIAKHIKILCWVMTQPKSHLTKAQAVRETWGRRCDVLYYVSTQEVTLGPNPPNLDPNLPPLKTVIYEGVENRDNLWQKTQLGFKYAYDNYFDDVDWFLKADDDTYVVMENLRLLLLDKNPSDPVYYGCRYKGEKFRKDWVSGGPGYVLSKEALKRFAEEAFKPDSECDRLSFQHEDSQLGFCMDAVDVSVGDSTDPEGKPRFFHFQIHSMLNPRHVLSPVYWSTMATNHTVGEKCCSDSIIGMHYVDENLMRTLDYAIYKVHPFGINPVLTGTNQIIEIRNYLQQKVTKNRKNVTKNTNPRNPLIL